MLLESEEGSIELKPLQGTAKTQAAVFSMVTWTQYPDLNSKSRARDQRPTTLLDSDTDPRGSWYFVVEVSGYDEEEEECRYFDLEGGRGFSIIFSSAPESGSIIRSDAAEVEPGRWRLTPRRKLKACEYGLYSADLRLPYDFGIDK